MRDYYIGNQNGAIPLVRYHEIIPRIPPYLFHGTYAHAQRSIVDRARNEQKKNAGETDSFNTRS